MKTDIKPIFILSLPRSGSTLLQSMLAMHPAITTAPETWILLPPMYALRENALTADYVHKECFRAWTDLNRLLKQKGYSLQEAIHDFAHSIYCRFTNENTIYFLDKTPRYYLIAHKIQEVFPEARFIIIYRNPVSVVSSMIHSFHGGAMTFSSDLIDLRKGPRLLVEFTRENGDRIHTLQYEDLVRNPNREIEKILSYLALENQDIDVNSLHPVSGVMGDRKIQENRALYQDSLESYKNYSWSIPRKRFLMKFLKYCGQDVINEMGYDFDGLKKSVRQLNVDRYLFFTDIFNIFLGSLRYRIKQYLIQKTQ